MGSIRGKSETEIFVDHLNILRWFGICPIYLNNRSSKLESLSNAYVITLYLLNAAFQVHIHKTFFEQHDGSKVFSVGQCAMNLLMLSAAFISPLIYRRQWKHLITMVKEIEEIAQTWTSTKSRWISSYKHFYYILFILLAFPTSVEVVFVSLKAFFVLEFFDSLFLFFTQLYQWAISFLFCRTSSIISEKYQTVKEDLNGAIFVDRIYGTVDGNHVDANLKEIKRLHTKIYFFVRSLNDVFGWSVLSIYGMTTVSILLSIYQCLHAHISSNIGIVHNLRHMLNVMNLIVIANSCNRMDQLIQDIINTLYLQQENMEDSPLREEMLYLARYLEKTRPKFSAAGFFTVNIRSIMTVISVTMTYSLVTIQMR